MTPEKRFNLKIKEHVAKKHPNYPAHLELPVKSFNMKTANGLTQAVIAWVQAHGYQAERVSTTGRQIDNRTKVRDYVGFERTIGSMEWIPGTGTKGSADVHCSIPLNGSNGFAVSVKIEIKIGKDRMSPAQKKYGEQLELAGGIYIVVKTIQDLLEWWDLNVPPF